MWKHINGEVKNLVVVKVILFGSVLSHLPIVIYKKNGFRGRESPLDMESYEKKKVGSGNEFRILHVLGMGDKLAMHAWP